MLVLCQKEHNNALRSVVQQRRGIESDIFQRQRGESCKEVMKTHKGMMRNRVKYGYGKRKVWWRSLFECSERHWLTNNVTEFWINGSPNIYSTQDLGLLRRFQSKWERHSLQRINENTCIIPGFHLSSFLLEWIATKMCSLLITVYY